MRAFTYAERPDLAARTGAIEDTFAPFLDHGEVVEPNVWMRHRVA